MPKMFHVYYPDAASVLADPNGRVIITDGRNHLELTDHRYDIIITDPPPPIESAGVSVISSHEYYQAGRDHLNPGGIMMQWVPWGQTLDAFKAHVRTFRDVFPHVLIAFGPGGYGLFMLGSEEPIALDPANIRGDPRPARASPRTSRRRTTRPSTTPPAGPDGSGRSSGSRATRSRASPATARSSPTTGRCPSTSCSRQLFGPKSPTVTPGLLRRLTPSP